MISSALAASKPHLCCHSPLYSVIIWHNKVDNKLKRLNCGFSCALLTRRGNHITHKRVHTVFIKGYEQSVMHTARHTQLHGGIAQSSRQKKRHNGILHYIYLRELNWQHTLETYICKINHTPVLKIPTCSVN